MNPDLRTRLNAADPARGTVPWSAGRQAGIIDMILSGEDVAPAAPAAPVAPVAPAAPTAPPRRIGRRGVALAATTLLAAAAFTGAVVLPGRSSAPSPADPATATVRLELERLAARTGDAPKGYLYVRSANRVLEGIFADAGAAPLRDWATGVQENWTGWTCDDRQKETADPITFPTEQDRQRWLAVPQPWAPDALTGGVHDFRGDDLRALDTPPCGQMGSIGHPNPRYIASYPRTADAFLAKVRADQAAEAEPTDASTGTLILDVLQQPWLDDAQRAAGLLALQDQLEGYRVGGHETVAGIPGLLLVRDDQANGTRDELVIAATAPGLLRSATVLVDPARAAANTIEKAAGLPAGTVISESRVLAVGTVPDVESTP